MNFSETMMVSQGSTLDGIATQIYVKMFEEDETIDLSQEDLDKLKVVQKIDQ